MLTHIALKDGREASSFTSGEMVTKSQQIWDEHLAGPLTGQQTTKSVFLSADLESPFGFAALLGCTSNLKKVFIPGTFNMSSMLKSVPRQQSTFVVCDEEFYSLQVPGPKAAEYEEMCSSVTDVLVAGNSSGSAGSSSLFTRARATKLDKYAI